MRITSTGWVALVVLSTLLAALTARPAGAATFAVNSTADGADAMAGNGTCATATGSCTLRAGIQESNALMGPDVLNVPAGTYVVGGGNSLIVTSSMLNQISELTIVGSGARSTVVRGDGSLSVVFQVEPFGVLDMSGVTVSGSTGSGINVATGRLTLRSSTVSGNATGIVAGGPTTVADSTITGNIASGDGGGIDAFDPLVVTNSTISGNSAARGGGLYVRSDTTTVSNSTIAGNTATAAGGPGANAFLDPMGMPLGQLRFQNSIVANPNGTNCGGLPPTSLGNNLESADTCSFNAGGDLRNTNPLLGPLANNAGPTDTHALPAASPAIDAGGSCPPPTADQRGISRPQGVRCDIGAFERQSEHGHTPGQPPGGPRPSVVGTGGAGGGAGPCGGGGGAAGGLGAGGGGAGGGGCFGVVGVQSLAAGAVTATAGVATDGTSIRAEVLADIGGAKKRARASRLTLIGQKTMSRLRVGRYKIVVRLNSKARKAFKRKRRVKVTLRLRMTAPTGHPLIITRAVTLKRGR